MKYSENLSENYYRVVWSSLYSMIQKYSDCIEVVSPPLKVYLSIKLTWLKNGGPVGAI